MALRRPRSGGEGPYRAPDRVGPSAAQPLAGAPTRVCVAQIGAPHGVRGDVRIRAFTEDPMAITRYGVLETEDGRRRFEIERIRPGSGGLIATLSGVIGRNAAEDLTNVWLYVPRDRLPPIADEEIYYHADLIGLAAHSTTGEVLGKVIAVHDFGAGSLLEIERPSGPTALLPFTRAVVPVVDMEKGRMVVDPPEGLIEGREAG